MNVVRTIAVFAALTTATRAPVAAYDGPVADADGAEARLSDGTSMIRSAPLGGCTPAAPGG